MASQSGGLNTKTQVGREPFNRGDKLLNINQKQNKKDNNEYRTDSSRATDVPRPAMRGMENGAEW